MGSASMAMPSFVLKVKYSCSPAPSRSILAPNSRSKKRLSSRTSYSISPRLSSGTGEPRMRSSSRIFSDERAMSALIEGILSRIMVPRWWLSALARCAVPMRSAISPYAEWVLKYSASLRRAEAMSMLPMMSFWLRLTTPTNGKRVLYVWPSRMARESVPSSIRSSLVSTPKVRSPLGSTSFAIRRPSLLARSALAGETVNMTQLGRATYLRTICSISRTVDSGCPSTATLVSPGRSTSVRLTTLGEHMVRKMGTGLTFFDPAPTARSVSASISCRTARKLVSRSPLRCANSPYSSVVPSGAFCRLITSGRRVQMPALRGRKSLPTMASSTELLPADCPPTTAICGSASYRDGRSPESTPRSPSELHAVCRRFTSAMRLPSIAISPARPPVCLPACLNRGA
mmetsp:Transcript_13116/g.40957  ORF Transcript_13116/g.40957 Transcript_13116/m.40957 type:complete len:401 (-) Transcript_13116:67-1269(-)